MRAGEWWEYKLVPILSGFYASAVLLQVPLTSLWAAALALLLSMANGAVYVSLINDLSDRADDIAAGKPNRLVDRPRAIVAALIALTVAVGVAFAWWWRDDPLLLACCLGACLAFSLYSLPPCRLKARGIAGVVCDACGAHLFPTLIAVIVAFRAADRPLSATWLVCVGGWALAYGLRGILWHQLTDAANDHRAGVRTFAQRHPPAVVARLGAFVVFPVELAALAAMLWQLPTAWPPALLAFYALLSAVRLRRWKMNAVIVAPKPRFFIVLHEYYDVFFPLALLVASAIQHPHDVLVLAAHLLAFPRRAGRTVSGLCQIARAGSSALAMILARAPSGAGPGRRKGSR